MHDVLVEHLHAALVVVGDNFRFGHRAAGDVALLERLGRTFGFAVEGAPLVADDGTVFSSTYIRSCVDAGRRGGGGAPRSAARTGSEGVVVRGDQRGRELGFPTANLLLPPVRGGARPTASTPAWLVRGGEPSALPAAVSIGTNPTFSGRERRVEAYVLDFAGDLYGERRRPGLRRPPARQMPVRRRSSR